MMSKPTLEVLEMIIADMQTDVAEFEGKPFNGKTLGELHGILAATIQALAKIMKKHIEEASSEPEGKPNE
jgi:hypothetical protein